MWNRLVYNSNHCSLRSLIHSEVLSTYIGNDLHQPFETVYGLVSFDEHGQNNGGAFLTQVRMGKIEVL